MDLLKIVRSFEEFLFEALTWFYFFPRTLWQIVRNPLGMMDYSNAELGQPEDRRYDDGLSPPVLLLITLVVVNGIGWAAHTPSPQASSKITTFLYASQQNLLLFRCLIFSLTPLVSALTLLRLQGRAVARETLRAPFYGQCYLAAPFATGISLAISLDQQPGVTTTVVGLALMLFTISWLLCVQTLWFERELAVTRRRAAAISIGAFLRTSLYLLLIVVPVATL